MLRIQRQPEGESRVVREQTRPLSIVIVNWNTHNLLARCLESIANGRVPADPAVAYQPALEKQELEVVVVDNASADGSADLVRGRFPWAKLVQNRQNVGFARANNQVLPGLTGRHVLLLNPDTEVRPGALEALVDFMDQHPAAAGAGPRLLNSDGTHQSSCDPAPTLLRELWRLFHLDRVRPYARYPTDRWPRDTEHEVDTLKGACLIVRRAALDQVGPLDEAYFIYSEEVDLCHRLRQRGWKLYWVPWVEVVHHGGQSTRLVAASMFLRLYQGKVLYFRKRHGPLTARAYKLILLIATLARLALTPLAWLEGQSRRHQHLALAQHYWRLLRALPRL